MVARAIEARRRDHPGQMNDLLDYMLAAEDPGALVDFARTDRVEAAAPVLSAYPMLDHPAERRHHLDG